MGRKSIPGVFYVGIPATQRQLDSSMEENFPRGYPHCNKTYKGAKRHAKSHGMVFLIDFRRIPRVVDDSYVPDQPGVDEEFIERQFSLWGEMLDKVRKSNAQ